MSTGTTEIMLSTGQKITIQALTGLIADDQHSSSTRIYSSGGGGYVGQHGGYVDAPQISSVTTTYQRFWITDDKGIDHEIAFQNLEVPLRVGQRVTAYIVQPEGSSTSRCELLFNHSTQLVFKLARHFRPAIRLTQGYRGSVFATLLVAIGLIVGYLSWVRIDQIETQALNLRARSPDCQTPNYSARATKAQRLAAQTAFADCKAHLPEILTEFRKATATHAMLTRQAGMWSMAQFACVIVLPIGGLIRWLRRSQYKQRVLQEYLDKLDATANSGTLA